MSLAYQGYSLDEFPEVGNTQVFLQELWDSYIERMFLRRRKTHDCTDQQTKYWLMWMAQQMVSTSQTIFFIENIQPTWIHSNARRILLYGLLEVFVFWLVFGISATLIVPGSALNGQFWHIILALVFANLYLSEGKITPLEPLAWSWKESNNALWSGLRLGLIGGLFSGLLLGLVNGPMSGLILGLIVIVIVGLGGGFLGGIQSPTLEAKTKPNQGMWKSAHYVGRFTLIFGLVSGILIGVGFGPISGVINGIAFGLIAGLSSGGSTCIRHCLLRLTLYLMGYAPWNYTRFLDYATERLFLQKVGGGYIFIHRMLLEHFAQMELEQKPSK